MPATLPTYQPSVPSSALLPPHLSLDSSATTTGATTRQSNPHFYSFMGIQPSSIIASTVTGSGHAQSSYMNNTAPTAAQPLRFRSKAVCRLNYSGVELFSTDCPPKTVGLLGDDYTTEKCQCRIRDVACITCGNQVGYHVTQPCKSCLDACNNGHMHMFHSEHIQCVERHDLKSGRPLLWATLPPPDRDSDTLIPIKKLEDMCR